MQFLQESPANTIGYMIAGYGVIFGMMFFYLVSLIVRRRSLEKDIEVLQEIEDSHK